MQPILRFFRRKSSKDLQPTPADLDYEIITFAIQGKDEPTFDINPSESNQYDYSSLPISQLEDRYLYGYSTQDEEPAYVEYTIQSDDTIYGLELKFNISSKKLLEINSISEAMIFPGMKIKLPLELKNILEKGEGEEVDLQPQKSNHKGSFIGVNLMDEIQASSQSKKLSVQYMTDSGIIEGILTVNEDVIFFDPLMVDLDKSTVKKYQASINLFDIQEARVVELPAHLDPTGSINKDFIIQILLSAIGKKTFEDKYKRKLDKMKKEGIPLASIYLRLSANLTWEEQKVKVQEITDLINNLVKQRTSTTDISMGQRSDLVTSLPYFDMYSITKPQQHQDLSLETVLDKTKKILGTSCIIPRMVDESKALNHDKFVSIISNLPSIFRVDRDWKLHFSTHKHGSSQQTLMRQLKDYSPLILVIKDLDGYVFGAYLSEPIQNKSTFYGSGETFIFTFHDTNVIKIYNWSRVNSDFVLSDQDGIAIGCGDKYALYINHDMSEGYTAPSDTFANDLLSKKGPYHVDVMEVWGLDYY